MTWNDRRTVQTGWIRIASILKEIGLTGNEGRNLSVKVEIDTSPPDGGVVQRSILTRHLTFVVSHYDLPSLRAGKLYALLVRSYPKGRDWYDLIWYGSHRPPVTPNLTLLQNALDQTEGPGEYAADQWPTILRNKLDTLEISRLIDDVQSFLERPEDRMLLERRNLLAILGAH